MKPSLKAHSFQFDISIHKANMKNIVPSVVVIIALISFLCICDGIAENLTSLTNNDGNPVQIITLQDHKFELQIDKIKSILEVDDLKDRYVVIVSIVGALREGKSFLLNFFLRYLNAMVSRNKNITTK